MNRTLKIVGISITVLLALLVAGGAAAHVAGKSRLEQAPQVAGKPVSVPADTAALARGEHLINAVGGCRFCHGDELQGEVFFDGELGSYVFASNLTGGAGGIGATYSDADWEMAIRHGIGADGRALVIMPSSFYSHLSDADLGALIAYLETIPAVDNDLGLRRIGFPGSVLGGVVGFNEFTHLNRIDHAGVGVFAPPEGVAAAYGQYMVSIAMCAECHAANLAGTTGANGPPPGPNLTPGGELAGWNETDFITALRSGQTPSGRQLDSEQMPWPTYGQMSDTELRAIWAYLQSLPALPANP